MAITLPHKFVPRDYQVPIFDAMESGYRRAVMVMHRRGGKDKTCLNIMISKIPQRKGAYYYYFPTLSLGRKILWDGMDKAGMKFMDHFPRGMVVLFCQGLVCDSWLVVDDYWFVRSCYVFE